MVTNPRYFEGIGEIVSVEQNTTDGKWYGIDSIGRAVIVQNDSKEWVIYDRPTEFVASTDLIEQIPDDILTEIPQDQITRINKDGETLPWGIIDEKHPYEDSDFAHLYISGYALGTYIYYSESGRSFNELVFEVPLKYERLVVILDLPDQTNRYSNIFSIINNDFTNLVQKPLTFHDYMNLLVNSPIRGMQMVQAIQINNADKPNASSSDTKLDQALKPMIDGLRSDIAVSSSYEYGIISSWSFIPESLFK